MTRERLVWTVDTECSRCDGLGILAADVVTDVSQSGGPRDFSVDSRMSHLRVVCECVEKRVDPRVVLATSVEELQVLLREKRLDRLALTNLLARMEGGVE